MLAMENQQAQEMTDMKRENDRKMMEIKATIDRSKVEQDQAKMGA